MKKIILYFFIILLGVNLILAAKLTSITLNNDVQVFKIPTSDGLSITSYNRSAIIVDNIGSVSADLKIFGYDGSILIYYTLSKDNTIKIDFNKDRIYDAEIGFIKKDGDKSVIGIKGIHEENTSKTSTTSNSTNTITNITYKNNDLTNESDITNQKTFKTNTTKGLFITLIVIVCILSIYYIIKKE